MPLVACGGACLHIYISPMSNKGVEMFERLQPSQICVMAWLLGRVKVVTRGRKRKHDIGDRLPLRTIAFLGLRLQLRCLVLREREQAHVNVSNQRQKREFLYRQTYAMGAGGVKVITCNIK